MSGIYIGPRLCSGIGTNNASPKQVEIMSFTIFSRPISPADPTLVIAEIGVNHDGSLPRALELVDHAHRAGPPAVAPHALLIHKHLHDDPTLPSPQHRPSLDPAPIKKHLQLLRP